MGRSPNSQIKGVKKPQRLQLRLQLRKKQHRAHPSSPNSQIKERANNGALLILRFGRRNALGHKVVVAAPNVLKTERLLSPLKECAKSGASPILRSGSRNALGKKLVAAAPNVLACRRRCVEIIIRIIIRRRVEIIIRITIRRRVEIIIRRRVEITTILLGHKKTQRR